MRLLSREKTDPATALRQELFDLRRQYHEMRDERDVYRNQLEGTALPETCAWLQGKNWAQRKALDALNRRVISQRLALRTIEELGRGLSRAEYLVARDKVADERLRDRVDEDLVT